MYRNESGENISKSGVHATNKEINSGFILPVFNTLSVGLYTQLMRWVPRRENQPMWSCGINLRKALRRVVNEELM